MSILDGVIGGVAATAVASFVQNHGGVQGIISQFEEHGLGDTVRSWVGTGANMPISAEQIHKVLGNETITKLADTLGIPLDKVASHLSEYLPEQIDKMTPDGQVPTTQAAG